MLTYRQSCAILLRVTPFPTSCPTSNPFRIRTSANFQICIKTKDFKLPRIHTYKASTLRHKTKAFNLIRITTSAKPIRNSFRIHTSRKPGEGVYSAQSHSQLWYRSKFMTKRIAVLLSGRGSNFEALAESVAAGRIPNCEISIVLSNREGAPGIDRARQRGLATRVIPSKGLEREAFDRQVVTALNEHKVDLVCLAGYMRLLSPYFVAAFPNRILNIHPSLLPSFPGLESQRQALDYGVRFAGCTVHFVDENLDAGPIILQAAVPVEDKDTEASLSEKILREEHRIYTEAVKIVLEGNFKIVGRRVIRTS
jgi:phosphoribosylglycinamide formyltransferase 1